MWWGLVSSGWLGEAPGCLLVGKVTERGESFEHVKEVCQAGGKEKITEEAFVCG